ncbi:hypothetical protein SAMN05216358_0162 [Rhizobium sp. AN5]|nr:hypothetical protein SAMN05216358_0162 [Rhizobium sp. AN5]
MLLTAVSVLAACSVSTPSARAPINLPAIPVELQDCGEGVLLPDRKLNQLETETYWLRDRKTLKNCRNVHKTTIDFYEDLRTRLSSPD